MLSEPKDAFRAFVAQFAFLQEEEIALIVENTQLARFPKGHLLLEAGQTAKSCYAVIEGCVREYHLKDGHEISTAFFTEGEAVNSFSSYSQQIPSKHYLECTEDCLLTIGSQSIVDQMCAQIPRLNDFLKFEVEKNAGALQERMAFWISSSPEERFLDLLENRPRLLNRVAQHQIASYLGIRPETLSRLKRRYFKKEK